jgi:hypothetical protein
MLGLLFDEVQQHIFQIAAPKHLWAARTTAKAPPKVGAKIGATATPKARTKSAPEAAPKRVAQVMRAAKASFGSGEFRIKSVEHQVFLLV